MNTQHPSSIETLQNLTATEVQQIAASHGTPTFVYDELVLQQQAKAILAFPAPFGLTARYAMKANPHPEILRTFHNAGLHIDASSGYEAAVALQAGIPAENILVTTQEFPHNIEELVSAGVQFNACSLNQLEQYGKRFPGTEVGIRVNPGMGSGHSEKTNVGGPTSSFGIWYEYLDRARHIAGAYNLRIIRIHTHIGSGTDPDVWADVAHVSLETVRQFPDVRILNLGGGFKVARMSTEKTTDVQEIGERVAAALQAFAKETGRELHMEIEPGTFLTANTGSLITTIHDIVDTGADGYTFLKIDAGMTEILRPALYGAQHPLVVVEKESADAAGVEKFTKDYIVVGHCCESGDLLTPHPHDPEKLLPRRMQQAQIGDLLVIEGVGAYCASMSAAGYNSFPPAQQCLRTISGEFQSM